MVVRESLCLKMTSSLLNAVYHETIISSFEIQFFISALHFNFVIII